LNCDAEDCSKRDYKGNYQKAFSGELDNFIGVSEPYEKSDEYDLILNTAKDSIDKCSSILLNKIKQIINI
jgi:adenylylsulfate kinase